MNARWEGKSISDVVIKMSKDFVAQIETNETLIIQSF